MSVGLQSGQSLKSTFGHSGHKAMLVSEAKAFQELLKSEREQRSIFEKNKYTFIKNRNPLVGEPTPRDDGPCQPIFDLNPTEDVKIVPRRKKNNEVTGKIGIDESKHNFLGNLPPKLPRDLRGPTPYHSLRSSTPNISNSRPATSNAVLSPSRIPSTPQITPVSPSNANLKLLPLTPSSQTKNATILKIS